MADNYYQQQQGFGGGRQGRGRSYRGRGRQSYVRDTGARFGGRSTFSDGGRGSRGGRSGGNYYGRGSTIVPSIPSLPPQQGGRGDGGRFSNVNAAMMPAEPSTIVPAPPTRGRGTRGSGRFYDGRGRRGRGRYASRGRGRQEGRGDWGSERGGDPQQWSQTPVTTINDAGVGTGPDWTASAHEASGRGQQDLSGGGDMMTWNNERTSSFADQGRDAEWSSQSPATGAPMDLEIQSESTEWAGRDRDWNSQGTAGQSSSVGVSGPPGWHPRDTNWNISDGEVDEGRVPPNAAPGMPPQPISMSQVPPTMAHTSSAPFPYTNEGDFHMNRKRPEAPSYHAGGPPFEDKRPRQAPTSSYASLGEVEFQNPPPPPLPPTILNDGPPTSQSRFQTSSQPWRGRGSRGRGRGRGSYRGRGNFGYQTGRGAPPSHYEYHDVSKSQQQYPDSVPAGSSFIPERDTVPPPGLNPYGPQIDDYSRTGHSSHPPFPPGEGVTGPGSFRRPSQEPTFHSPLPPPTHVPPAAIGMQSAGTGVSEWNRPPPIHEPIITGSYASLAAENPFVPETAREPVPPPSTTTDTKYQATESTAVQPKRSTPPREPVVERPPSPPSPVGPPSGLMIALARLADLESQLDFALAKHAQVTRERELIEEQTKHLKELPVGVEAFEEDLAKLSESSKQ